MQQRCIERAPATQQPHTQTTEAVSPCRFSFPPLPLLSHHPTTSQCPRITLLLGSLPELDLLCGFIRVLFLIAVRTQLGFYERFFDQKLNMICIAPRHVAGVCGPLSVSGVQAVPNKCTMPPLTHNLTCGLTPLAIQFSFRHCLSPGHKITRFRRSVHHAPVKLGHHR